MTHLLAFLLRLLFRVATFALAVVGLLVAANVIVDDSGRIPVFLGLLAAYVFVAYGILPRIVRLYAEAFRRGCVPQRALAADGLPADPVNLLIDGSLDDIRAAFTAAGWTEAEPLTLRSAVKVATCFVLNRPYPTAPFSPLFLFGRRQDHGFQEPIGHSPRKRNHVRIWAAPDDLPARLAEVPEWTGRQMASAASRLWAGTSSEDLGFGLTHATFQLTHRIDRAVDGERSHVVDVLDRAGWLADLRYLDDGRAVDARHYLSDGRIAYLTIRAPAGGMPAQTSRSASSRNPSGTVRAMPRATEP